MDVSILFDELVSLHVWKRKGWFYVGNIYICNTLLNMKRANRHFTNNINGISDVWMLFCLLG